MNKNETYAIPIWFFKAVGFASVFALPWIGWVSINIAEMCANQKVIITHLEKLMDH